MPRAPRLDIARDTATGNCSWAQYPVPSLTRMVNMFSITAWARQYRAVIEDGAWSKKARSTVETGRRTPAKVWRQQQRYTGCLLQSRWRPLPALAPGPLGSWPSGNANQSAKGVGGLASRVQADSAGVSSSNGGRGGGSSSGSRAAAAAAGRRRQGGGTGTGTGTGMVRGREQLPIRRQRPERSRGLLPQAAGCGTLHADHVGPRILAGRASRCGATSCTGAEKHEPRSRSRERLGVSSVRCDVCDQERRRAR